MQIIAPGLGDNLQLHKLSEITLKMISTAVFPNFHDLIWTYQNLLF